jgi:hypothetical protein
MQNLPLTEKAFIRALQDVDTPAPPLDLLSRLQARRSKNRRWLWAAVPVTAVTVLTAILVVSFSLPSAISVAQVAKAFDAHSQYTITNTRILGGGKTFQVMFYRDGALWRRGNTFGLADRTLSIAYRPKKSNFAIVDERQDPPMSEFRIDHLLRQQVDKGQIDMNVHWNGRIVDRYTVHTSYGAGRTETYDQVLIVDPKTKLPIMRDNASWGDIWDYLYGAPPAATFSPSIPPGTTVYDLRDQRKALTTKLQFGDVGGVVIDESRQIWLLTNAGEAFSVANIRIEGIALNGRVAERTMLGSKPIMGSPAKIGSLRIGGTSWHVAIVQAEDGQKLEPIWNARQASGTLDVDGKEIAFKSVPVIRTGSARMLLRPFLAD